MKVVFINISDVRGGASIVANRLRLFLKDKYGVESRYLVADRNLDDPEVMATRGPIGKIIEKVIDKSSSWLGLQYQFFPISSFNMVRVIREFKPDVISIHNTHGGFFETRMLRKLSRLAPVVWTLHDMWSFTGNAAHTFGDDSWKRMRNSKHLIHVHPRIGINTGSWLLNQKASVYRQSRMLVLTPSAWLRQLAMQSPAFAGKEVIHIANGVNLEIFKPHPREEMRQKLKMPYSAKVIMFSAGALANNMWKGGDHLLKVLTLINGISQSKIDLLVVGEGDVQQELQALNNLTIHQTGYVQSEAEMAAYYSASDLFIYPTKADTLPTVLIESIACGTPCVTFDIGGCSEIIIHQQTGVVIPTFELEKMAAAAMELLDNPDERTRLSINARKHAEKEFSMERMAERYFNTFEEIRGKPMQP